jgi:hypothetical protein
MHLTVNSNGSLVNRQPTDASEGLMFYNMASMVLQIGLKIIAVAALTVIALPLSSLAEPLLEAVNLTPLKTKLPKLLQGANAIFQIFIGIGSQIFDRIEDRYPIKKPRYNP